MKKINYSLGVTFLFFIISCTDDIGSVDITYTKANAIYGDLNTIRQTPLISQASEIENPGKIFISNNTLLIGEENEGVHIFDNTDPENPQNKLFINIPGNKEFYVQDEFLYAESYYDMVKVDISSITQPALVSRVENAFSSTLFNNQGEALIGFNFEEVTESLGQNDYYYDKIMPNEVNYFTFDERLIPESAVPASFAGNGNDGIGSVNRIAYSNEHVYVISRTFLTAFSDVGNLELLSSEQIGWQMETIYPYDDKLFIGTQGSMEIIDISTPGLPQPIGTFRHANGCDPVYPIDNVAYVTVRAGDETETACPGTENTLFALDIQQIDSPVAVQQITMESPFGMTMIGDKLYVGEGSNGLKIFDASNRLNLQLESWDSTIQAYDVIAHPIRPDILLITGPDGLNQYSIQADTHHLLSNLSF